MCGTGTDVSGHVSNPQITPCHLSSGGKFSLGACPNKVTAPFNSPLQKGVFSSELEV